MDLSGGEISDLAGRSVFGDLSHRAFVVSSEVQFGLTRMFATYREMKGGQEIRVEIAAPADIMRTLVLKGSVACDGISLTVAEVLPESFAVHIIPLTREHTMWGGLKVGDAVNLESDVLGKIALKLLSGRLPGGVGALTCDDLRGLARVAGLS